jgi:hypothetical protein
MRQRGALWTIARQLCTKLQRYGIVQIDWSGFSPCWQHEIWVLRTQVFTANNQHGEIMFSDKPKLAAPTAEAWTSLILLCAQDDSRSELLALVESVMVLEEENHTHLSLDLMTAADELKNLRAHSARLFGFLLRTLSLCRESNVPGVLPHAESIREYIEAWDQRILPTDGELRMQLETLAMQCREQKTP